GAVATAEGKRAAAQGAGGRGIVAGGGTDVERARGARQRGDLRGAAAGGHHGAVGDREPAGAGNANEEVAGVAPSRPRSRDGDLALRAGVDADEAVVVRDRGPVRNHHFADAIEADVEMACVVPARLLPIDG